METLSYGLRTNNSPIGGQNSFKESKPEKCFFVTKIFSEEDNLINDSFLNVNHMADKETNNRPRDQKMKNFARAAKILAKSINGSVESVNIKNTNSIICMLPTKIVSEDKLIVKENLYQCFKGI